jgi:hypothetical protein
MNYWEIIADNLTMLLECALGLSAVDSCGRTIWIADAYCGRRQTRFDVA